MPKSIKFPKGSIIFFENNLESYIYILQSGCVQISTHDLETGAAVQEFVKTSGEFFGVKSAIGNFRRDATAQTLVDSVVIQLTVDEFESILSRSPQLILKMLRVFSKELRSIHAKTRAMINDTQSLSTEEEGMFSVAKIFMEAEEYQTAIQVMERLESRNLGLDMRRSLMEMKGKALLHFDKELQRDADERKRRDFEEVQRKTRMATNGPELPKEFQKNVQKITEDRKALVEKFRQSTFRRFLKLYEKNDVIICEHEKGETFYLILSGEVALIKCIGTSKKQLDVLKTGELFGEMAILDNSPRSASCVAFTDVECLEFNRENFNAIVTANPQIAMTLMRLFCKRIYDQRKRFRILTISDYYVRIAGVLCTLDEIYPTNSDDMFANTRVFNVTVSDIADWAGISADECRMQLSKYERNRRVTISTGAVTVKNIVEIKHVVDSYLKE